MNVPRPMVVWSRWDQQAREGSALLYEKTSSRHGRDESRTMVVLLLEREKSVKGRNVEHSRRKTFNQLQRILAGGKQCGGTKNALKN